MALEKIVNVTINCYSKGSVSQISNGIKNISSKQVISITHALQKKFFATATFEVLCVATFQIE